MKLEWKPIRTAPDFERVLVCGWQDRHGGVRGYWWWKEDVCEKGRAIEHPNAFYWCPMQKPDEWPPLPEGAIK